MKAIAIPYIIALVIGIVVLIFIVYWVYKLFGPGLITAEQCRSDVTQWCIGCRNINWIPNGGKQPACAKTYPNIVANYTTIVGSCGANNTKKACAAVGIT